MPDTKTPNGEPGSRIFARILSLDLACPACGEVHKLGQGRPSAGAWDPRTQRFQCQKCKRALALGVIAYSPPMGRATPAWDQIPSARETKALRAMGDSRSAREAQELRNLTVSVWVEGPREESANRWER